MRHSKRTTLTADDVDGALNLRNVEVSTMLEQMASEYVFLSFYMQIFFYFLYLNLGLGVM